MTMSVTAFAIVRIFVPVRCPLCCRRNRPCQAEQRRRPSRQHQRSSGNLDRIHLRFSWL